MSLLAQAELENLTAAGLTQEDWLRAGALLVGAIFVAVVVNRGLRHLLERTVGQGFAAIMLSRIASYVIFLVGTFYVLSDLGVRVGPLLGALGLGGLVLALAMQRFVENFLAGIILQARRPFRVGDTVRLGEHVGNIIDIDSRTVVLQGLDGVIIRLPNSSVVSESIYNLTRLPTRRSSLMVGVAYESDLVVATEVLRQALSRVQRVLLDPPPSVLLGGFGESSIDFQLLYWHKSDVPSELAARHDLVIAVHQALSHERLTIAFPQVVVWSGGPEPDRPYSAAPAAVRSDQPGMEAAKVRRKRAQLRRPKKSSEGGNPTV